MIQNHIDYNVYIPILNELSSNSLEKLPVNEKLKKFGTIKIIDSSTISMAKTYFQWAEFRSTKSGIKLHTKFDLNKGIPEIIVVSNLKDNASLLPAMYNYDKEKLISDWSRRSVAYISGIGKFGIPNWFRGYMRKMHVLYPLFVCNSKKN